MPIAPIPPDGLTLYHLHGFWDPFSAASHLLGAVAFLVLGVRLVCRGAPDRARQFFLGVYGFSCVLLLLMSGMYHTATDGGTASGVLVRLDHGAIFILIAGTFTPMHGLLFRGAMRWAPLAFIWSAALVAAALKIAYFEAVPEWVGLTLYLVMGWLGFVGGIALWRREGFRFIRPLALGGAAFTAGALMDFCRWPVVLPGVIHAHDVFHVAALVGYAFHFSFIWQFAEPSPGPAAAAAPETPARRRRSAQQRRRFAPAVTLLPAPQ